MMKRIFVIAAGIAALCSTASAAPSATFENVAVQKMAGDPWIYQVYKELYNRQPTAWELNINNYNNGSWNNYAELKQYVKDYQASLSKAAMQINVALAPKDKSASEVGINLNGNQIAVALISNADGHVITSGGANVVAAGGGNVVAAGGGNVIAVTPAMLGISHGSRYTVQSVGTTVVSTSGKGALIIR